MTIVLTCHVEGCGWDSRGTARGARESLCRGREPGCPEGCLIQEGRLAERAAERREERGAVSTLLEEALGILAGPVAHELLRLERVRALVREHPADAVPVLELAAVARAAGVEVGG